MCRAVVHIHFHEKVCVYFITTVVFRLCIFSPILLQGWTDAKNGPTKMVTIIAHLQKILWLRHLPCCWLVNCPEGVAARKNVGDKFSNLV